MMSSCLNTQELYCFRTKVCRRINQPSGCSFGLERCQYSHSPELARRCPIYLSDPTKLRYIPTLCPDQKSALRHVDCPRGATCPYAHSNEEIDYHPLVYKRKPCSLYKNGQCASQYCPHYHDTREQAAMKRMTVPYTRGCNIPKGEGYVIAEQGEKKGAQRPRSASRRAAPMLMRPLMPTTPATMPATQLLPPLGGSAFCLPSTTPVGATPLAPGFPLSPNMAPSPGCMSPQAIELGAFGHTSVNTLTRLLKIVHTRDLHLEPEIRHLLAESCRLHIKLMDALPNLA